MLTANSTDAEIVSNGDEKTSTEPHLRRRRRGAAAKVGFERQQYRQITHNGQLPNDSENRRVAIQSHIREGLYKKRRVSRANQVEVSVPPGFLSSSSAMAETQNRALHDFDTRSKSFELSFQRSTGSLTLNTSSETAVFMVGIKDTQVRPRSLTTFGPMSRLGAGRADPFANYPIRMSREEKWLIDQSESGGTDLTSQCSEMNDRY